MLAPCMGAAQPYYVTYEIQQGQARFHRYPAEVAINSHFNI